MADNAYIPQYTTGWEHGSLDTGGNGVCDSITNATRVTIVTDVKRSFARALKVAPSATNDAWQKNTAGASLVGVYFRINTLPTNDMAFAGLRRSAGTNHHCGFGIRSNGNFALFHQHSANAIVWGSDGPAASVDTWYFLQWFESSVFDVIGKVYGFVDDTAMPTLDATAGHAGGTLSNMVLGNSTLFGNTTTETLAMHFDDLTMWNNSDNAPVAAPGDMLPSYSVEMLTVDDVGTHNTATNFTDDNGNSPPTNVAARLSETPPFSIAPTDADFVVQTTISTTSYIEVSMTNITSKGNQCFMPWVVALRYADGSGNSSTLQLHCVDNAEGIAASDDTIFGGALTSGNDQFNGDVMRGARDATSAPISYITKAEVDQFTYRFGYSSDVTPNPGIRNIFIEIGVLDVGAGEGHWQFIGGRNAA